MDLFPFPERWGHWMVTIPGILLSLTSSFFKSRHKVHRHVPINRSEGKINPYALCGCCSSTVLTLIHPGLAVLHFGLQYLVLIPLFYLGIKAIYNKPTSDPPHIISIHVATWNMIHVLHGKKTTEWKWNLGSLLINTPLSSSFLNVSEVDVSCA